MQKKTKALKKSHSSHLTLTRSLSARISPFGVPQKMIPGSLDVNFLLKSQLNSPRISNPLKMIGANNNQIDLKDRSKKKQSFDKNISLDKKNHSGKKSQILFNGLNLKEKISELKREIFKVTSENKKFKKFIESRYAHNGKKLFSIVEKFKTKLQNKLSN